MTKRTPQSKPTERRRRVSVKAWLCASDVWKAIG